MQALLGYSALAGRSTRQILLADKNYHGTSFEADLGGASIELPRPARKGQAERPGARIFKPLRQIVESVNDTLGLTRRSLLAYDH